MEPSYGQPLTLESSPFAPPKPGQTPEISAASTPRALALGVLDWDPIDSRCTFTAAKAAPAEPTARSTTAADGETRHPYVFVTMLATGLDGGAPLERGYVMANGLVRELEKGKTAADKASHVVTVWRSASEPRINVNLMLDAERPAGGTVEYSGAMTVFWGDKKEEVPIRGRCG
ncbi:hypothetical protein [Jiella sp. M17.18]|uniref:hypothetical protein n=1 Tax=Jiella sp. M17.18 TaxID=3234247 RepID=UPI0034DF74E2